MGASGRNDRRGRRPVLIYGMNYAPEMIGVGRYSGEIGAFLHAEGEDVEVVTTPPHYPGWAVKDPFSNRYSVSRSDRLRVSRCPLLLRTDMRGLWRVLAPLSFAISSAPVVIWRILTRRPRAVLMIEPTLFAAPAALLAAKLVGARTALHVQDLEIDAAFAVGHMGGRRLKMLADAFERITLKRFDQVITISNQMKARLLAKGVAASALDIVRNWVDLEKIRPLSGPNRFRSELGLTDDAFVALYSGNIGAKQALPVILDAAEQMKDNEGVVFVVAGEGPEKASLMERYGALPNLRFLPLQPEDRLCELLNLADVHLLPQDRGAADLVLPSKLGGMLASGRPILVTADEGTELYEFLRGTAVVVPAGDRDSVRAAITALSERREGTKLGDGRMLADSLEARRNLTLFSRHLFGDPGAQPAAVQV